MQIEKTQVDVVVMDIAMPDVNGLEATRHLKAMPNAPYVVILTLEDNAEYRAAAVAAGADGFVNKLYSDDELPTLLSALPRASLRQGSSAHVKPSGGGAL